MSSRVFRHRAAFPSNGGELAGALLLSLSGCGDAPPQPEAAAPQGPAAAVASVVAARGAALRYPQVVGPLFALAKVDVDLEVSPSGFRIVPPYPNKFGEGTLPEKMRALADARRAIDQVAEVAMMDECEWPFLGASGDQSPRDIHRGMRQAARILTIDGLRMLSEGDKDRSALRLAACLGLSRHVARGDTTLDAMVASAIFGLASDRITMAVDGFGGQRLDSAQRAVLATELARFDPNEPFGTGMTMERCLAADMRAASDKRVPSDVREMSSLVRGRERCMSMFAALKHRLSPPPAKR